MTLEEFGSSLSVDEIDRLMRVVADVHYVTVADAVARTLAERGDDDAARRLLEQREATWGRLSGDGEFLIGLMRRLGESGLQAAVGRSTLPSGEALASFQEKAGRDGGILPLIESRLRDLGGSGTAVAFASSSTLACVGGVLLIVSGVAEAALGAELLAGFSLAVGVVVVASAC